MAQSTAPPEPQSGPAPVYNLAAHRKRHDRCFAHPLVEMRRAIDDCLSGRVAENMTLALLVDLLNEADDIHHRHWQPGWFLRAFGMEAPA